MQPTPVYNSSITTPTYGANNPAVGALQQQLNDTNKGISGYVPLAIDNKYGPLTAAAANFKPSNVVTTAGPAQNLFNTHSTALQSMLTNLNGEPNLPGQNDTATVGNTHDAYTNALDNLSANSSAATKALIGTINAQRASQGATTDAQYANYKGALQQLGIQHNEAQFTPDLLTSHINEAENEHQQKITELNVESNKALMDAEKAQSEGDLDTLDKKMAYIKDLNQQKQDYLKNIADNITNVGKIADSEAAKYYDAMQKLPADQQEAFLKAVVQKFPQVSLGDLTAALVREKASREKDALDVEDKESLINSRNRSTSGGGTAAERKQSQIDSISAGLVQKPTNSPIDNNGYITPNAWNYLLTNSGLNRKDVIDNFGYLVYTPDYSSYHLTPVEVKQLNGALPDQE